MVYVLVHELGHYLGLEQKTANGNKSNIVFESVQGPCMAQNLRPDQIEDMHEKLSRNLARRGQELKRLLIAAPIMQPEDGSR